MLRESTGAPMTPAQMDLVRESFEFVAPIAPQAAALFFENLFTADPKLRSLFKGNLVQTGDRMMTTIANAVRLIDHPEQLATPLSKLGARHVTYGVRDEHYATVGTALMKTLQQSLGDAFTDEVRAAWGELYASLSGTMMKASREASTA
jgi:hemoglobin-like flavoprotein